MRRITAYVAVAALLGLTACAMKDEAPAQAPVEVATVEVSKGGGAAPEPASESNAYAEERSAAKQSAGAPESQVRGLLGALDGSNAPAPEPSTRAAPAPPPPPPAKAAFALPVEEVAVQAQGYVEGGDLDDTVAFDTRSDNGIAGLGLRGSGRGGGGTGEGRIGGLGKLDLGGGKGRGPGYGASGKKAEKKKSRRRPRPARAAKPKPAPMDKELSRLVALEDDGDDLFADEDRAPEEPEVEEELEEREKSEAPAQLAQRVQRDSTVRHRNGREAKDRVGGEFEVMLDQLDEKDLDGRFWQVAEYPQRFEPPPRFIPRMCYFENTYLGGNAAYTERLRRLDDALPRRQQPYRAAALPRQPFDAPDDAGLALTATLDRAYVDQPQRVFLQVGLQGSKRFGWRRPPLDIALVVDGSARDGETLVEAITALSRRLGPQDRLGVVLAGPRPEVIGELSPLRDRLVLARAIEALGPPPPTRPGALAGAMDRAGEMLQTAAGDSARIPGTQTVLVLTRHSDTADIDRARGAAHRLTVQGAVTSVVQLGGSHQGWWQVANAGHGNYHRVGADALAEAVDEELGSIAKVIARLLRINVKLADGVEAIRIVGSRVLGQQEVKEVKAREEATDRNLSKTMGVKADRGDDDDGIQTVIPYFYGGDSHVILLELWVTRPGPVAEVTLKYKDMVALTNATARVAAAVDRVPRDPTPAERRVAANVRGFQVAEGLAAAAAHAESGNRRGALGALDALEPLAIGRDRRLVNAFEDLIEERADHTVAEALRMAHDRRIGHSP